MNIKQAKELVLVEFIRGLGHEPTSIRGNDVWFRSPFRPEERTPSFKVDARKNVWYDFARGEGGTIIDFVQRYHQAQDVSSALAIITEAVGGSSSPRPASPITLAASSEVPRVKPVIEHVQEIQDRNLVAYLGTRAIPVDLARLYLKEVEYRVGERTYLALGFQNDSAGFEVRNQSWKGSLGTKDITSFRAPGRTEFAVFEGSFDFLATLAFYGLDAPKANVVVLNSVALVERAKELLQAEGATKVYAYLDRDPAGAETFKRLEASEAWHVQDASSFYDGHKDANEFLQAVERDRRQRGRDR